ncbi:MAG TPA: IS110 family transposase [Planctomycetota bacterium]|nr:IS110 family transposase [Planctomycetota bacterium]
MSKMIYLGMDVHLNLIAVVWGRAKEKARCLIVDNSPKGWEKLVQAVGPGEIWGVYEASSCGFEVYDHFTKIGWRMSVVAPTHIHKSVLSRKRKTDLRDAKRLWEVLVSHGELGTELPAVWIPEERIREEREIVRRRLSLADHRTRVKNGITSLLRMHKLKRPCEMKTAWSQAHVAWLKGLSSDPARGVHLRTALGSLLRELEFLDAELAILQKEVEKLSGEERYRKMVEYMTELDGVGVLTAMTFLVELGDVRRFRNRRQVASYLGLVPTSYESGEDDDHKGPITHLGPARVRKVLNQAAWTLVRKDAHWKARYGPLAARRGALKAIVAIMRKLGIELWHRALAAA